MLYVNGQPFVSILAGNVNGNSKNITSMGNITFITGAALASGGTNGNTLLLKANDTTFITFTTGATDVCTIANPTFSGTALASGTFTMPNFTFGAQTKLPASGIILGTALQPYYIIGGADTANDSYIVFYALGHANTGRIQVFTYNGTTAASRLTLSGGAATAVATWAAVTHSGLDITSGEVLKVAGTQVVGARVVDARADDVVDTTYGAEEAGVLDALRDAMIAHGLIAAA